MPNPDGSITNRQVLQWVGGLLGFIATLALTLGGGWAVSINAALADQDKRIDEQEAQNREILTKLGYISSGIQDIKENQKDAAEDISELRRGQSELRSKVKNLPAVRDK